MTDTWGIPGSVFAGGYLVLLVLPALSAAVRLRLLRRGHGGGAPERVEELALLTGGRPRVGEVVVARLLEQQIVRLDSTGRLSRVQGTASDDLGRAALGRIGKHGASVDWIRHAVGDQPAVAELEAGLIARGLLADPGKVRSIWVSTAVAAWLLVGFGLVRLIVGSSTGHPVGYLLGLVAVGTVAAIAVTVKARNEPPVAATAAGRAAGEEARRAGTFVVGSSGSVASGGLAGHPDKDVRLAVTRATQRPTVRSDGRRGRFAGAAGGGFAGFYGGSSCGGGGGVGGGGGGGCGG